MSLCLLMHNYRRYFCLDFFFSSFILLSFFLHIVWVARARLLARTLLNSNLYMPFWCNIFCCSFSCCCCCLCSLGLFTLSSWLHSIICPLFFHVQNNETFEFWVVHFAWSLFMYCAPINVHIGFRCIWPNLYDLQIERCSFDSRLLTLAREKTQKNSLLINGMDWFDFPFFLWVR